MDSILAVECEHKIPFALVERWWDTTNTFHLAFGEMTLTPLDFTAIMSIKVGGTHIPWDIDIGNKPAYIESMLG